MALKRSIFAAAAIGGVMMSPVSAQTIPPNVDSLITPSVIEEMREWIETDIVRISIGAQNARLQKLPQEQIDALVRELGLDPEMGDRCLGVFVLGERKPGLTIRAMRKPMEEIAVWK